VSELEVVNVSLKGQVTKTFVELKIHTRGNVNMQYVRDWWPTK